MTRNVTVAAVHAAPVFLNTDATIDKAIGLIEQAGREGIQFLVFPEVFVPGFPYWINLYAPLIQLGATRNYQDISIEVPGPEIDRVRAACRAASVAVALGISERERGGRTCYNSQVFIDRDGTLLGVHRKIQPTFAERTVWGQGDGSTLKVWKSSIGRIGGLVCWEHTMNLARQALIEQGLEIHASSWPGLSSLVGFDIFDMQVEAMLKSHSLTGQCFSVVAMSPVTEEMIERLASDLGPQNFMTAGGAWSAVIHPFCAVLAGPHTGSEERLVKAEIDLDQISDAKVFVDAAGHYARNEILRLMVDDQPKRGVIGPDGRTVPAYAVERPIAE